MRTPSSLALLTALALAGGAGAQTSTLTGTSWTLTALTEAGGDLTAPGTATLRPTLRLDSVNASGSTGCNTYRASYALRGEMLRFGPLATTRRVCPDRVDWLEERFVNLLRGVTRYRLDGATPTLFAGSRDRLVLTARQAVSPRPEANVTLDGTWTLSGGTALRPVPGQGPSLTFSQGQVSGTGGCNRLTGSFRLKGETLTLGPLASTRMACAPAVNTQEAAFLAFLGTSLTVSPGALTLTLTNAAGGTLVFRRGGLRGGASLREGRVSATPPSASAADGRYALARVDGQPTSRTPRPVTLVLNAGRIGGTDGCNSFGGAYRLEGGRLVLAGPLTSTLMACREGDEAVNILEVLRGRPTVKFTSGSLTLTADGTTLEFTRAPSTLTR